MKNLFEISSDGVATTKLSAYQRRKIGMSSTSPVYKHSSWMVERKFNVEPARIPCIIFAHSLGDSGCPCRAGCIGMTRPMATGVTWEAVTTMLYNGHLLSRIWELRGEEPLKKYW